MKLSIETCFLLKITSKKIKRERKREGERKGETGNNKSVPTAAATTK